MAGRPDGGLKPKDPLERAVYRVLGYPMGPKAIRGHRTSIEAFGVLHWQLVAAGLLLSTPRWVLLRLIPVAVLVLCVVHEFPLSKEHVPDADRIGMIVAAHHTLNLPGWRSSRGAAAYWTAGIPQQLTSRGRVRDTRPRSRHHSCGSPGLWMPKLHS